VSRRTRPVVRPRAGDARIMPKRRTITNLAGPDAAGLTGGEPIRSHPATRRSPRSGADRATAPRGSPPPPLRVHHAKVSEQAVQHERDSEDQPIAAMKRNGFGIHRVKRVADCRPATLIVMSRSSSTCCSLPGRRAGRPRRSSSRCRSGREARRAACRSHEQRQHQPAQEQPFRRAIPTPRCREDAQHDPPR